jgi:hypothetical protein
MTTKKTAQKKTTSAAQVNTERLQGIPTLAAHISAVLTHPDTPVAMYNALADAVNGLDAPREHFDSAEYIVLCLRANAKATQKGGAR